MTSYGCLSLPTGLLRLSILESEFEMAVSPHVHIGFVSGAVAFLIVFALFGTLHLLALSTDNRWSRAFIALGF